MPNVIPFTRKRRNAGPETPAPRHRRPGFFDEQDTWHDEESAAPAAEVGTPLR